MSQTKRNIENINSPSEKIKVFIEEGFKEIKLANRFNEGKLQWSLVDMKSLEPMVKVLMFGAKKYSCIFVDKLEKYLQKWNVKIVKGTGPLELKNCVTVAMSNNCLIQILNIKKIDQNIKENIEEKMLIKFLDLIGKEINKEQKILNIEKRKEILTILGDMELPQMSLIEENNQLVSFVESKKSLCKQIITIQLENLEVCFAVNAIMGLDSSMMTLICLEKLLNISLDKKEYINSGANNWKKGLPITDIYDSLQRHLVSFIEGEDNDPESQIEHLGHAMCNLMFMQYMMINKPELDNRFKK